MRVTVPERRSDRALFGAALLALLLGATVLDGARLRHHSAAALASNTALVRALGIADLYVFGDAPHTRHLTQAGAFSGTRNHPGALDHSWSGSLVQPSAPPSESHAPVAEPTAVSR